MPAISGQTIVTTSGTATPLGSQVINSGLMVMALDTNTGVVSVGNDGSGDVALSNGLRLGVGDAIVFNFVGDLASIWLDAESDGDGVSWIMLNA